MYQLSQETKKNNIEATDADGEKKPGAFRIQGIGGGSSPIDIDDDSIEYDGDTGQPILLPQRSTQTHPEEEKVEEAFEDEYNDTEIGGEEHAQEQSQTGSAAQTSPNEDSPPPKTKKKVNPKFKDVKETGKWGDISRREIYAVIVALVLISIAVVVVVVVLVVNDDDGGNPSNTTSPAPISSAPTKSPAPTPAPSMFVRVDPEVQLTTILTAIANHGPVNETLSLLSGDVAYYEDKRDDPSQPPQVRALSWMLFDDPHDRDEVVVDRYALATFYYSTEGDSWTNSSNWLTDAYTCDWIGVGCNRFRQDIEQLDLSGNNVVGEIPVEVNLLDELKSLILRNNAMDGKPPALAIGTIPRLTSLFLQDNAFSGTISADFRANQKLGTLSLHFNDFTGMFPSDLCPLSNDGEPVFDRITLDCSKLTCACCTTDETQCY